MHKKNFFNSCTSGAPLSTKSLQSLRPKTIQKGRQMLITIDMQTLMNTWSFGNSAKVLEQNGHAIAANSTDPAYHSLFQQPTNCIYTIGQNAPHFLHHKLSFLVQQKFSCIETPQCKQATLFQFMQESQQKTEKKLNSLQVISYSLILILPYFFQILPMKFTLHYTNGIDLITLSYKPIYQYRDLLH